MHRTSWYWLGAPGALAGTSSRDAPPVSGAPLASQRRRRARRRRRTFLRWPIPDP